MGLSIFVLIKRLKISWFLRQRFCWRSRNLEFTIIDGPLSVRIAGGFGVLNPSTSPCRPPTSGQNSTPGGRISTPLHLTFAAVGMLLDSHFILMQFLKYVILHHDDLNVTTS